MTLRRIIVWTASLSFGLVVAVGTIVAFNTSLDKFGVSNAVLVFLSMGALAFIWLDFIFRTKYLRN